MNSHQPARLLSELQPESAMASPCVCVCVCAHIHTNEIRVRIWFMAIILSIYSICFLFLFALCAAVYGGLNIRFIACFQYDLLCYML